MTYAIFRAYPADVSLPSAIDCHHLHRHLRILFFVPIGILAIYWWEITSCILLGLLGGIVLLIGLAIV